MSGGKLVFIGQGTVEQARAFRAEHLAESQAVLLCDPALESYRILGWNNQWWKVFHPLVLWRAWLALLQGFRQGKVQGSPFQNGGVVLTNAQGKVLFRYTSLRPGDHPGDHELGQINSLMLSTRLDRS